MTKIEIKSPTDAPIRPEDSTVSRARSVDGMDRQLVTRAQQGDEDAFGVLARAIGGRLQAVAERILREPDRAEDATQQALVAIWRDLPSLRDPDRFESWAYRLLVRACVAEAKRSRRAPSIRLLSIDPPTGDAVGVVDDRDQLERGFRKLTLDQRTVVVLYHYLDLPVDEIATTLGIPVGTVRSRLHHALRGLRAALEADARPTIREVVR